MTRPRAPTPVPARVLPAPKPAIVNTHALEQAGIKVEPAEPEPIEEDLAAFVKSLRADVDVWPEQPHPPTAEFLLSRRPRSGLQRRRRRK